ncbi:hypothetical protein NitYY0826_C1472 [Nitratiruptor sp. YY08-26]|uniref:hypothetical protein n=1 Tax=unclassified Nitratiruptor TaxID=2624044 RepID=UPI0019150259|nr:MULTISPECIES: hypothetical protein [unclassified Nitratiruptor]BCD62590.1 hypothetical protein NitYY0813_C1470 [Nitratiruptor sp. YY08-13]BCD66526.1 hypothetical protein NitYY0826_C1472 [Nitratiruptor sp. YY08-26]
MVKVILCTFLSLQIVLSSDFDTACLACHEKKNIPLKPIFFEYLLYYSSKSAILKATKEYLLHPTLQKRLYKKAPPYQHKISQKRLDKLLEEYWERYKVIGKIK